MQAEPGKGIYDEENGESHMRKVEIKSCSKCGKTYLHESGGIVLDPKDFINGKICPMCRIKSLGSCAKKFVDVLRGED